MRYKCLSIAGFDGSGGAGIQADLKTFSALNRYGMTVLTAIPIQNTCGVRKCYDLPLQCIRDQLEAIFDDITPDAIKIGMLFSAEIVELVADFLKTFSIPIVLDPVMVAKSGDPLLKTDAIDALKTKLIPMASIITPNIPEAQALVPDAKDLTRALLDLGPKAVLLKGGHASGETSDDILLTGDEEHIISHRRIESKNTHGTGCTLSAAIASFLAEGQDTLSACMNARDYLQGAILASKDIKIGKGNGPLNHEWQLNNQ